MSKASYVGAPAVFALTLACAEVEKAFNCYGCYLVGSALEKPDWRDVDVRMIMDDGDFAALFPDAGSNWESNPRWLLLTTCISERLSRLSGLPVDFQFQPQTHANERHDKPRHWIGVSASRETPRRSA